jgi:hypothetical protein
MKHLDKITPVVAAVSAVSTLWTDRMRWRSSSTVRSST